MPHVVRFSLLALTTIVGVLAANVDSVFAEQKPAAAAKPEDLEFFERKIRPLLSERCYECHSAKAKSVKGELRLDSRAALLAGGESGPAVLPGQPDKSLLIQAVRFASDVTTMPPAGKLPAAEIELLVEWVRRGAPFPESAQEPSGAVTKKGAIDFAAGKRHWAFQPLSAAPVPRVADVAWPQTSVDYFVLEKLENNQLQPSSAAPPRELLRRLYFDLIGLPPTPDELAEFEREARGGIAAYEDAVDRLLADSRYGERWGRMWLDLVRYCDQPESWAVEKGAQAWLYRDWVAAAWNRDLPFDRFVHLQLAADLSPERDPADMAALGMIGLSPNYWKELQLDPTVIKGVVAEEWEERIYTLSGSLFGLTVACARCHDHKFDPISMEDYYGLAGVLASTRVTARPVLPESQAKAVREARIMVEKLEKERQTLLAIKLPSDAEKKQAAELQAEIVKLRETPHFDTALAYALDEASLHVLPNGPNHTKLDFRPNQPQDVAMQIRGNPANLGPVVPRRFLTVLSADVPAPFQQGSGRLELAQAITRDAAPLAARVIVNRIWKQIFGQALVDTPSNFGLQGSRPSHPELLDHLAARFIEQGWSLKWLQRELLLSATYRQTSRSTRHLATDADNRWLWRSNRKRLEVEAWRDAMLAATGELDVRIGGAPSAIDESANRRRTFYSVIRRRELHDMLRLYDFPDPMTHSANRDATTTPLQQLFVLNSPFFQQRATALAARVRREFPTDTPAQIRRAYQLLYLREPTEKQLQIGLAFLSSSPTDKQPADATWLQYAQVLLASNEVLFVD